MLDVAWTFMRWSLTNTHCHESSLITDLTKLHQSVGPTVRPNPHTDGQIYDIICTICIDRTDWLFRYLWRRVNQCAWFQLFLFYSIQRTHWPVHTLSTPPCGSLFSLISLSLRSSSLSAPAFLVYKSCRTRIPSHTVTAFAHPCSYYSEPEQELPSRLYN